MSTLEDENEIRKLIQKFTDCTNQRDTDAFVTVYADNASWQLDPPNGVAFSGTPAEIAAQAGEALSYFKALYQIVNSTTVTVTGDTATARSYITEVGLPPDQEGYFNYGLSLDSLVRTAKGWRFLRREYHTLYVDNSALAGTFKPFPVFK
ncbi:nuclear transport factor 2 family protein [Kutzneria sp. NPDC051319]|uniref:nuclear transport factor 2 family protein n=1 Tax=Kutzneria sp. NPDC051319 TaxID=3155047 RepID=UPI003434EAD9